MKAPNKPLANCLTVFECVWYIAVPAFGATNSYVHEPPAGMSGWVMPGTPSWSLGTSRPCQWMVVASARLLVKLIRTLSPTFALISGPGYCPL